MVTSFTRKLVVFTAFTCMFASSLYCFDMQREYSYLSILTHNANAAAFKKQLNKLIALPEARSLAFREMLAMLAYDVEQEILNTQAMHGADIRGTIEDNGLSQCKWGIAELALAALVFKFHPERNPENTKLYYGMLITSFGSGVLGLLSLKNSISNYLLARRYGNHIHQRLQALAIIKQEIESFNK